MGTQLNITGDGESWYLVLEATDDDGELVTEQIARFESEKAVRLFEAKMAQLAEPGRLQAT